MNAKAEVLFEVRGNVGLITLNRPAALNALTANMVELIRSQLEAWEGDVAIGLVVVQAARAKAFCAGGDIRALYNWGREKDPQAVEFYRQEYQLITYIKQYSKPYIALMDGITMGGGAGLSVHGSHRIATERLVFSMPETGIGLFPDAGGTFFLPRCPGETGMYLALTGAHLKATDAMYAGIVDRFIPSAKMDVLMRDLEAGGDITDVLARYSEEPEKAFLEDRRTQIDACFSADSVTGILDRLAADGSEWAQDTARTIRSKSPLSTMIAYRQVRAGALLEFEACMQLEFRLTNRFMAGKDFYEGVRAVLIDKDQPPEWQHADISEVAASDVEGYFAGLGANELNFD